MNILTQKEISEKIKELRQKYPDRTITFFISICDDNRSSILNSLNYNNIEKTLAWLENCSWIDIYKPMYICYDAHNNADCNCGIFASVIEYDGKWTLAD